ncbi:MAG: hypothetical protein JO352_00585 [Chloroflexi bacterium]|nr:hypothetical protein [Chloroflexota bacterium]MBV9595416.1 hypothetical protein [Chloroflexota bacterium]
MQACPAGLLLSKREAFGVTHDLAHTCVTKQVRVYWGRLADCAVAGCAQSQHAHVGSF